jgi:hypothetical protein
VPYPHRRRRDAKYTNERPGVPRGDRPGSVRLGSVRCGTAALRRGARHSNRSEIENMSRIRPVRTGWDPSPGDADFYPNDLPEDWRLTYFANAINAVALDADTRGHIDRRRVAQWSRDVPESFAFYLHHALCAEAFSASAEVEMLLGERFGGWILGSDQSGAGCLREPSYLLLGSVSAAADSPASALACTVPTGLVRDLRAARRWLEELASAAQGRPTLALLGRARFEDVRRWQSLVELLGLG